MMLPYALHLIAAALHMAQLVTKMFTAPGGLVCSPEHLFTSTLPRDKADNDIRRHNIVNQVRPGGTGPRAADLWSDWQ
jgi:hypothetical protein